MKSVPSMVSQQLGLLSSGATPEDVRAGQSFVSPGSLAIQTGTMKDNGDLGTIVPGTVDKPIPEGYTTGGTVKGDPDLLPANIKSGVDLFGVTGNAILAVGNATNSDVLQGKTFSSASGSGTGTMPNNGSLGTIVPGTTNQPIPSGYTSGGTVSGSDKLIASNIKNGVQIFGVTGNVIQATGSATADKLLAGQTASNAAGPITGTMPNNGSLGTITPGTASKPIPSGYTTGGTVAGSSNLLSGNIRLGVDIFGVTGSLDPGTQTGGTAQPSQVIAGETFTNDSGQQTGTMVDNGSVTITPSTTQKTIPQGYHDGNGYVVGDSNLVAGNIKSGVSIFGVTGSLNNSVNGQIQKSVKYMNSINVNDPIYGTLSINKQSNPSTLPSSSSRSIAFSPDGSFMAVGGTSAPYITIYSVSGNTFTKLPDPSTLPPGIVYGVAFSPDGLYMVASHFGAPYITIYSISGNTFTKIPDPATTPGSSAYSVTFSPDGAYMAVGCSSAPYVVIYNISGSTFTKLSNPATLPTGTGNGVSFNQDGTYLAVAHLNSPYVTIYSNSGGTFTKIPDPVALPAGNGNSAAFSSDGSYLVVAHDTSPFMIVYSVSGGSFGKMPNPTTLPTGKGYGVAFGDKDSYMAVSHDTSPYVTIYKVNGTTLTKQSNPSTLPADSGRGVSFAPNLSYMAIADNSSPYIDIYSYDLNVYKSSNKISELSSAAGAGYALDSGVAGDTKNVILIWR